MCGSVHRCRQVHVNQTMNVQSGHVWNVVHTWAQTVTRHPSRAGCSVGLNSMTIQATLRFESLCRPEVTLQMGKSGPRG